MATPTIHFEIRLPSEDRREIGMESRRKNFGIRSDSDLGHLAAVRSTF